MTDPLDPTQDPDRYDPLHQALAPEPSVPRQPLDWTLDPDRFRPDPADKQVPPAR